LNFFPALTIRSLLSSSSDAEEEDSLVHFSFIVVIPVLDSTKEEKVYRLLGILLRGQKLFQDLSADAISLVRLYSRFSSSVREDALQFVE
jgi:hypothetical protein